MLVSTHIESGFTRIFTLLDDVLLNQCYLLIHVEFIAFKLPSLLLLLDHPMLLPQEGWNIIYPKNA